MNEWDFLYGTFELFTNNRKRNQIYLLKNVIFAIKSEYNKEFDKVLRFRQTQVDSIHEKQKRIYEILEELRKPKEVYQPKKNILDAPEQVLTVDGALEIPFPVYLSREERERKEQERVKVEARLKALMADDSGQRAIKDMMGGTLEEKKETPLTEELVQEEWMLKPLEDMNEEERVKLKEFEVKR